ncbi:MAG: hypothetical protein ACRBN8_27630 [Nannocystales bacterium]
MKPPDIVSAQGLGARPCCDTELMRDDSGLMFMGVDDEAELPGLVPEHSGCGLQLPEQSDQYDNLTNVRGLAAKRLGRVSPWPEYA